MVKEKVYYFIFAFISMCLSYGETLSTPTSYFTDFEDESVQSHFIPSGIAGVDYVTPDNNRIHSFVDGALILESGYSSRLGVALVSGGAQSEHEVNINGSSPGYPFGIYTNTVIKMTYSLTVPETYLHTNTIVKVISRKIAKRGNEIEHGPCTYRQPYYSAEYDGENFQICEYTYSPANEFLYENTRVIASAPAKTATADGVYVITLTTIGGDDAGGTGVDTEPCMLSATLKYNNELLASISGVDNPFDWTNGPEISVGKDYIPQFNPTADWNRGTWSYSGGDWEHYTSWKMTNSDIRLPGWNAISMQHKAKIGGKKHGIRIASYSVKEVNPINPATCIFLK